ncbi:UDP-3-O-(3-hydroxymyristoyl)glucosamine N-acyltransferase [Pelagibaculum spongiae]|uniref:UDP-3-O-acylglucosamine N-acyltransferase n=1 Tax=Pelagibaculum spongiae TaxID=2080658 RepID=A0A2V1GR72_9GAMM|nr:UDP-3-O-(3-hydroxymyristoyl)glucosamine N-acyltransferase [Pelagibaculum spongiae]PVZ64904.1 UDP-3-O-(3-hydroxymyristoyl)glucosamine N-acyltransferase [Pelagibaculum spongiae]
MKLSDIAQQLEAELVGDGELEITGLSTLETATAGQMTFLANRKYESQLEQTKASVVIVHPDQAEQAPCAVLKMQNPYLGFAMATRLFDTAPKANGLIHPSAVIAEDAEIGSNVTIGAFTVIDSGARIGDNCMIGARCSVGQNSVLGESCRLWDGVTLYHDVKVGQRAILHSGSVLGADGFGFANEQGRWVKIHQLGGVTLGDDVEVGVATAIDRGALTDTIIGNGVKIDNQVQIAHNVQIKDHCALAGQSGVAGSSTLGKRCTIAGGGGVSGHLELTDDVHVMAMTMISRSVNKPGMYASPTPMQPHRDWLKNSVRFRHLDKMARQISELQKSLAELKDSEE